MTNTKTSFNGFGLGHTAGAALLGLGVANAEQYNAPASVTPSVETPFISPEQVTPVKAELGIIATTHTLEQAAPVVPNSTPEQH